MYSLLVGRCGRGLGHFTCMARYLRWWWWLSVYTQNSGSGLCMSAEDDYDFFVEGFEYLETVCFARQHNARACTATCHAQHVYGLVISLDNLLV